MIGGEGVGCGVDETTLHQEFCRVYVYLTLVVAKKRRRKKETFFSPLSLRVQPTSSLIGCLSVHVCLIIGAALQFGHTNMRIPSH